MLTHSLLIPDWDYHLSSTSAAIDAGDPGIASDLIYDGNGDGSPRIDWCL